MAALAQKKLSGVVVDSKTGEKLPFVNVVYTSGGGTQTDLDGHFTLPFRAGRLRLSVIGYETKTVYFKIFPERTSLFTEGSFCTAIEYTVSLNQLIKY